MLDKPSDRHTRELQDPMLSALLREALADDPALEASPGRTDRIMRKVLASGVRPARRAFWAPFAWAGGAFATAAAAVVLVFMTARLPGPEMPVAGHSPGTISQPSGGIRPLTDPRLASDTTRRGALPDQPKVENRSTPEISEKPGTQWTSLPPANRGQSDAIKTVNSAATPPAEGPTQVAAALYEAGNVAKSLGDYESAYRAYQASYEASPTPAALLASSSALEEMAELALSMDDLSS